MKDNKHLNSKVTTSAPMLTMHSSSTINHSEFQASDVRDDIFNAHDKEFLSVLEDLVGIYDPLNSQNKIIKVTSEGRISGYFCSDTVFN